MIVWVWGLGPNHALEQCWHCQEYKTEEEARRKSIYGYKLFKVEVTQVDT
jgi:hypothetical protein